MNDAAENASNKTETLSSEFLILKDDFEEAMNALKQKEEKVRVYKEQIEKMGSEDFPKSPMDGDKLVNAFWKRWIRDYFPSLLVRQKWHVDKRNVCVGDVGIIQDLNKRHDHHYNLISCLIFRLRGTTYSSSDVYISYNSCCASLSLYFCLCRAIRCPFDHNRIYLH
jgi:hypothetical protein